MKKTNSVASPASVVTRNECARMFGSNAQRIAAPTPATSPASRLPSMKTPRTRALATTMRGKRAQNITRSGPLLTTTDRATEAAA
jgi:hypothetical protein